MLSVSKASSTFDVQLLPSILMDNILAVTLIFGIRVALALALAFGHDMPADICSVLS